MDTRSSLPDSTVSRSKVCVYCGQRADSNDHAPPRCFLRKPLPSNLITLPSCKRCNTGFSFDEQVVKTLIALTSEQPELVAERMPGGRVDRALARDARLRRVLENATRDDGNYELKGDLQVSFDRVIRKTVRGLFFGLYERVISDEDLSFILVADQRHASPDNVAEELRPSPMRDITDEPMPEITPFGWVTHEPVVMLTLQPIAGGEPVRRVFRLVRETEIDWVELQPDVFRFVFIKTEHQEAVCVMDIWKTLVVAIRAPWPDGRGPIRRGRNNRFSREHSGDRAKQKRRGPSRK